MSLVLSFQLHRLLHVLKLYYKVASSHLPAPQILRVLKSYYKVASSQLPAPQIAPRTKVVLQSRRFSASSSTDCSAYSSCTRMSLVLSFQLHRLLRVLKLYYKVASSHLPAPQILRVLKSYYKVASSQLPAPQIAPRTKVVLQSRRFSASSSTDCSAYSSCTRMSLVLSFQLHRLLRVLKLYYKVASSHLPAPQILRALKLY